MWASRTACRLLVLRKFLLCLQILRIPSPLGSGEPNSGDRVGCACGGGGDMGGVCGPLDGWGVGSVQQFLSLNPKLVLETWFICGCFEGWGRPRSQAGGLQGWSPMFTGSSARNSFLPTGDPGTHLSPQSPHQIPGTHLGRRKKTERYKGWTGWCRGYGFCY